MTVLFSNQYASSSYVLVCTNNKAVNVVIDAVKAHNNDTTDHVLYGNIVPSGQTVANSNCLMQITVPAGQTWLCADLVGCELNSGDTLWMKADTDSVVSLHGSGRPRPTDASGTL